MRYYFLQADNTPGGPETLETLVSMAASEKITLATLVVPAGGEDWTPLARVLGFYYADAQSQTAGPVPFSEISRLQQVRALTGESWVLPQGSQQWIALKEVLAAGGVALAQPAVTPTVQPRTATAPVRQVGARMATAPISAGESNPYAAPRTQVRRVVVHNATGGLDRLKYFLFSIGLGLLLYGGLFFVAGDALTKISDAGFDGNGTISSREASEQIEKLGTRSLAITGIVGLIMVAGSIWLAVLRNRNIGWPWPYIFFLIVPIVSIWYSFALLAYPPGYTRHRRFDTVTKVLLGLIVAAVIAWVAVIAFAISQSGRKSDDKKRSADDIGRAAEEAIKNRPATQP